jgi:hypothetical protein
MPESPRWLVLSGAGLSTAVDALRRTKGSAASEAGKEPGRDGAPF